ncbi:MAG TPA: DUF3467 domain-containing protein [candidate division Zixibacteria bacterium]|nr:DUF3467 domain-containing protein [bacterium]HHH80587.1 DUF3467 domain-containing protein [candidate division Zixibacteria bacterium]
MPNGGPIPGKLQIEIPENVSEGTYSNLVIIAHSPSEFVLDFVRAVPGVPKAKVQARIIMTPINVKNLMKALEDNIKKYESKFGEIKVAGEKSDKTIGFSIE